MFVLHLLLCKTYLTNKINELSKTQMLKRINIIIISHQKNMMLNVFKKCLKTKINDMLNTPIIS